MKDLHHIRSHYEGEVLDESTVSADPLEQFEAWFSEAQPGMETPNAMILATAGRSGAPSARVVLLKSFSSEGFTFYTNYESDKGKQLEENPQASLLFYWPALHRQVRIEGTVKKVDPLQSQQYFSERPRESQVSAWASQQSQEVTSKRELEERCKKTGTGIRRPGDPLPVVLGRLLPAAASLRILARAGRTTARPGDV